MCNLLRSLRGTTRSGFIVVFLDKRVVKIVLDPHAHYGHCLAEIAICER